MAKSILKEIGIIILLLLIIVLVFAIVLYDYNPSHKTIPKQLQEYRLPADVETELSKTVDTSTKEIVKTYTVTEKDLKSYERTNEYDRGKINPFRTSTTINEVMDANTTISDPGTSQGIMNIIGK